MKKLAFLTHGGKIWSTFELLKFKKRTINTIRGVNYTIKIGKKVIKSAKNGVFKVLKKHPKL